MTEIPKLPPCPTDSREWHLAPNAPAVNDAGQPIAAMAFGSTGTCYQNRLYCRRHGTFINPAGNVCEMCGKRTWPEAARLRAHVLPGLAKAAQEAAILAAVKRRQLTERDALDLGREYGL